MVKDKIHSRYQMPIDTKTANNLASRCEALNGCEELGIDIRRRFIGYLYKYPWISGNQAEYMSRFNRQIHREIDTGSVTFGRYHIARRIQNLYELDTIPKNQLITDIDELNELYEQLPNVIVYAGTACSGKNYHGEVASKTLGMEADDTDVFHPEENVVDKMHKGLPLEDKDREVYIHNIIEYAAQARREGRKLGLIFPSHTEGVRDLLREVLGNVLFIRFSAPRDDLILRANSRKHDYIPNTDNAAFIDNQIAVNQPLTQRELGLGDFEVRTDEAIPIQHVRIQIYHGIRRHWHQEPLKRLTAA